YSPEVQKVKSGAAKYGFGTSVRVPGRGMNPGPGPGAYNQSPRLGQDGPKYTVTGKYGGYRNSEVPGPGAYHGAESSVDLTT
ncbi:unnamed protein product, partial [Effrenium voratum]